MKFAKVVLKNFQKDFKELLPKAPGYLNCKIIAGHGNCKEGISSDSTKEDGLMLLRSDGFKFERVLKIISAFSNSKSREPLLLYVNLMIPSGTIYIYRLYEIERRNKSIFLGNQSCIRALVVPGKINLIKRQMMKVKERLKNLKRSCSILPNEKNGMDNLKSHINSVYSIFTEKIQEVQECEKQMQKMKRTIRIRRIRAIFGLFSY